MPVATTSGCCEKPDRNSDSQTTPPLTLMFYATHPKSARDPPVGRDPHFENHWCIHSQTTNWTTHVASATWHKQQQTESDGGLAAFSHD
ncbi:hypothetical protein T11_15283 [Trichinella zimbabwensis]|uniref:Uncharacterized protein n=1 Tax=Trichinella zimbabwensis TaxID=268475 RepID=A0A0V1HR75_9BILA|nr:hypothetical protein T11_15283 [Trichinella zimbabwensis]